MPIKRRLFRKRFSSTTDGTSGPSVSQLKPSSSGGSTLSTPAKIGITAVGLTAVGTGVYVSLPDQPTPTTDLTPEQIVAEARAKQPVEGQLNREIGVTLCGGTVNMTSEESKPRIQINTDGLEGNYFYDPDKDGYIMVTNPDGSKEQFKVVYYTDENNNILKVDYLTGVVTPLQAGESNIKVKIYNDNAAYEGQCIIPYTVPEEDLVQYYFVNTLNSIIVKGTADESPHGEAIIMKTATGKYVLLDAGSEKEKGVETIIEFLKTLQGTDQPVIDYLIVSHMHGDHAGGVRILLKKDVVIRNIIYKDTQHSKRDDEITGTFEGDSTDEDVLEDSAEDVDITGDIGYTNRVYVSEGSEVIIDKFLTLKFYNTSDVWAGLSCSKKVKLTARSSTKKDYKQFEIEGLEGKHYVYIDGTEFAQGIYQYHYADTVEFASSPKPKINNRFYLGTEEKGPCGENANSYAILGITYTGKDNNGNARYKYAYFPSDIQNAGYNVMPDENGMFGDTNEIWFEKGTMPVFKLKEGNVVELTDKNIVSNQKDYQKPQETQAAIAVGNTMRNKGGELAVYQVAHHGYNNALNSLKNLGIVDINENNAPVITTKSNLHSVFTLKQHARKSKNFSIARSHYYLSGTHIMDVSGYSNSKHADGVKCNITNNNNHSCNYATLDLTNRVINDTWRKVVASDDEEDE